MSTLSLLKTAQMQPEDLSEGKLIGSSGCEEKDEGVPEEVMLGKLLIEDTLGGVCNIESQRMRCWKLSQA